MSVEDAVRAWVDAAGVPWEAGARPGEYVVQLPGEAKLRTTVSLLAGRHGLSATAFVVRRPDENHDAFHRWLLTRNARLPGVAFALDAAGDVFLVARLPREGVTVESVDRLMGAMLGASDSSFNDLLALGFLSSMRREWQWRVDRGESTANLEAFRHLLDGAPNDVREDTAPMTTLTVGTENGTPVDLYYEDLGTGRPVVLIHGWPLSGKSWQAQVPALVEGGYRVVTYDRRGFGASSQPEGGYDYDTFTADLDALLTHLNLHDVTLVGFSMGGGEVVRYLGTRGSDRVTQAVLAAAVPPYLFKSDDNPDGGLDDAAIAGFEAGVREDRAAFLEQFTTTFFSADGELKVSEEQRQDAIRIASAASPKATLDCIAAFGRTDFRADLAKIDIPTLVIHGDADAIVPFEVSGKRSAESIGMTDLVIIDGGPHGINASHPYEFNTALLEFLAR